MHKFILAAAALSFAAPALAQPASRVGEDIVRSLPHPYDVEAAGDKLGAAVGAILDVPIGGVVGAIDPAARVDPRATIGDVAGRDDPGFEHRVQEEAAGLSIKAADMVRGLAVAAPVLQRSIGQLERDLARALGGFVR